MAILKVARLGHPVLRKKARALSSKEIESDEIKRLIEDMIETMAEYGGIGLAAPQVHESIQLALVGFDSGNARYPGLGEQPLTVVINPKVTVLDEAKQGYWEGCLSVPDMRGLVFRPRKIQIDFLNHQGESQKVVAEGFLATVFQHELDHLEGVVYVDRIEQGLGKTQLAFSQEYERYLVPEEDDSLGELVD